MNTPAHLIFGLTVFGRADSRKVTSAAFAGALIPDLSLYLLVGWHLGVMGTEPQVVFGQLYFSESWQAIFRIDNSFVLWGIGFALAWGAGSRWAMALTGAALLHIGLDFPLHHDDGRAHFWPISTWIFQSPVSYWDPAHYGRIAGLIEVILALVACVLLWRRFAGKWMRGFIVLLATVQAVPSVMFAIMFSP